MLMLTVSMAWTQASSDPDFQRANDLEQKGQFREAAEIFRKLYDAHGADVYFWRLMLTYERLGDYDNMEWLAMDRLKRRPDDAATIRYLARAYYGRGEREKGYQVLLDMIEGKWADLGRIGFAAGELSSRGEVEAAIDLYLTAREKTGKPDLFAIELARLYANRFAYNEALAEYLKMLDKVAIVYKNAGTLITDGLEAGVDPETFIAPLDEYRRKHPESVNTAKLLSSLYFERGDYEDAYEVVAEAAQLASVPEEAWAVAEMLEGKARYHAAREAYRDYYDRFNKAENRATALIKAAGISEELGFIDEARADYTLLTRDYSGTADGASAVYNLMRLSRDNLDDEAFMRTLTEFASTTPYPAVAFDANMLLAETALKRGQREEASQALANARIKARGNQQMYAVAMLSARYNFFIRDDVQMRTDLQQGVRFLSYGEDVDDLLAIVMLSQQLESERDHAAFGEYAAGQYALFRGEAEMAIDSLTVAAKDTGSVVAPYAARELGKHFSRENDYRQAVSWYLKAADAASDTTMRVGAMIDAADILHTGLGEADAARDIYFDAMTTYPGTVYESLLQRKLRTVVSQ